MNLLILVVGIPIPQGIICAPLVVDLFYLIYERPHLASI